MQFDMMLETVRFDIGNYISVLANAPAQIIWPLLNSVVSCCFNSVGIMTNFLRVSLFVSVSLYEVGESWGV